LIDTYINNVESPQKNMSIIHVSSEESKKFANVSGTDPAKGFDVKVFYNADGSINEEKTYTGAYREKLKESRSQDEPKNNKKAPKENNDKEGCLTKIIKAPFRFLWWLVKFIFKNALVILTLGLANGWFNDDKD